MPSEFEVTVRLRVVGRGNVEELDYALLGVDGVSDVEVLEQEEVQ